jgi:hypothetical protein
MSILQTLTPIVDGTLTRLGARAFDCDPLMGAELSRITSVVSSAYKRHGHILEAALKAALQQHERFVVWDDPQLPISSAAESLATSYMGNPQAALQASIAHEPQGHRTLQVDMVVFDQEQGAIRAYEVKRGAGTHDAGKRRSMLRDLLCTQVVLRSYAEQRLKLPCTSAHAHIVIYYGAETLGAPFTLTRSDLDSHFGVPVVAEIEEVNDYYRGRIEELLGR